MNDRTSGNDDFTTEEQALIRRHCSNLKGRCFALENLPEVVKGALFARYSRTAKSLRRLLVDEFARSEGGTNSRAAELYERVLGEYGDDSVAQLGSAHIACEGVSNVMTKILERGRLMSYLEQSTRYVAYTERPKGRWKYRTPVEVADPELRHLYELAMNQCFATYAAALRQARDFFRRIRPREPGEIETAYERAVRAKALDTVRGLLPAATISNLGIHGSGQAFEALLLRLGAHELDEARAMGSAMLQELKKVIPAFVARVERPDRGGKWRTFLSERRRREVELAERLDDGGAGRGRRTGAEASVRLIDHDPEGEIKVLAGLAYEQSDRSFEKLMQRVRQFAPAKRGELIEKAVGSRENRRHRPGRAFELTEYTFEVVGDYGAFRDLQRHRMLSIEWQKLDTAYGATRPEAIDEMGARADWDSALEAAGSVHEQVRERYGAAVAQYAVPMAYRIRFLLRLNAREAMHMMELRTQPAGHPAYRKFCQQMHRLIAGTAGHHAIAAAMRHVNHDDVVLERLAAEQQTADARRRSR